MKTLATQPGSPAHNPAEPILNTPLPVLAGTSLCLALVPHQPAFDLRSLARILSRDPAAVLRLFALVAQEMPDPESRPERLEDCIASVQTSDLLLALSHAPSNQVGAVAFAHHAHTIGCYARIVASSLGLCEHRAFLVGLLHAIGTFPPELRRLSRPSKDKCAEAALKLARSHGLPPFLCAALLDVHRENPRSIWMAVVHAAHDLASRDILPPKTTSPAQPDSPNPFLRIS